MSTIAERHRQAKQIFLEVIGLPIAERRDHISAASGGDSLLAQEVESLLAFHDTSGPTLHSSGEAEDTRARLKSGDLFAGRYRIVSLLGCGGMGEVYRAHDTLLDVPVALKMIGVVGGDYRQIVTEVRLAREITHHAICRVFDVGEEKGRWFFTMEYVDGEDLASLLRRIGRLPMAKVIEIAVQICSGLSAAHAKGVLHRDLKPANIMIDGRGKVRITDFGIASTAAEAAKQQIIAGTPAYMAPEQFIPGAALSPQTDLYALGLVLWEMVTGQRSPGSSIAAREELKAALRSAEGVDPRLESAIAAALENDPAQRPPSALALAAMLPGVSPLSIATDAGVTPPPEIVAASGESAALPPVAGSALFAACILSFIAIVALNPRIRPQDRQPFADAPVVVAARARAMAEQISGVRDSRHAKWTIEDFRAGDHPRVLYRTSPVPLTPALRTDATMFQIGRDNPPLTVPGMQMIVVDSRGNLVQYAAVPPPSRRAAPIAWASILPPNARPVTPAKIPPFFADQRLAWIAPPQRIDAALRGGHVVWIDVAPLHAPAAPETAPAPNVAALVVFLLIIAGGAWLARRNVRLGRSDRIGARRVAWAFVFLSSASLIIGFDWTSTETAVANLTIATSLTLATALLVWMYYLALEPFIRRRYPHILVAWSRLLGGAWRDPIVARDVFIGASVSIIGTAFYYAMALRWPILLEESPAQMSLRSLLGVRFTLAEIIGGVDGAVCVALLLALLFTFFVYFARKPVIAGALVVALFGMFIVTQPLPVFLIQLAAVSIWVVVFIRFGLLALAASLLFESTIPTLPLSFVSSWQTELSLVTTVVLLAMIVCAFLRAVRFGSPRPISRVRYDTP